MQDPLSVAPGRRPLLQSKTTSTCAQSGAGRRPLAPLVLAAPPSTSKIPTPPHPLGQPRPTMAGPAHATPGAVFGRPPPCQPPPTLGRGPSVGHFLSTPYPRMPKPTPRETRATPSALFVTPRVGHLCPRRRPLGPLRPSVESRLSGAYCQPRADESPRRPLAKVLLRPRPSLPPRDVECLCPRRPPLGPPSLSVESPVSVVSCRPRADGCPRPPRAKALLHPRPYLPPRRVERLYPPFSATMKKGVQAMGVQVAGARKLKSKAEGRGTRRRRH